MPIHLKSVDLEHHRFPETEHYPFALPVLKRTERLTFETPITFLVGGNGTGKSTLLEALARASGVHIWSKAGGARHQMNPYEDRLHQYLRVEWADGPVPGAFFGSETFRDFADTVEAWAAADPGQLECFGGASLVTQSHGQSMMSYFRTRYEIQGIYLLDEPETALSPKSQLELLKILGENGRAGHAQFIIASHSPILLACRDARIYSFDQMPVGTIDYEATEHYQVYRDFLLDRERYL